MVDGANRLQAFIRVTLPLYRARVAGGDALVHQRLEEFLFAFVFITSDKLMTLPVGLAQTIFGDIYPWGCSWRLRCSSPSLWSSSTCSASASWWPG
ncbi:MAG: hypothetical protein R2856_03040 [Caldilineaceae bacterium]